MISAGLTRWRCPVLRASTTLDVLGRRSTTYTNVGTIIVDARENPPSETSMGAGVANVSSFELRTRWPNIARVTMTTADRIQFRNRILRIEGIRNLEQRNRVAVIDTVEVA